MSIKNITVTLGDKSFSVPSDRFRCENLYKGFMDDFKKGQVNIPMSETVTSDEVVNDYIQWLNSSTEENQVKMKRNLLFAHSINDDNYLSALVEKLVLNYDCYQKVLDEEITDPALKRKIYLYCPHSVVPRQYMDDDSFLQEWMKTMSRLTNCGKPIIVNERERYIYQMNTVMSKEGKETIESFESRIYVCRMGDAGYDRDGPRFEFYEDGSRETEIIYDNGDKIRFRKWNLSGILVRDFRYDNGECKHGTCKSWYDSGNKHYEIKFVNDKYYASLTVWSDEVDEQGEQPVLIHEEHKKKKLVSESDVIQDLLLTDDDD